MVAWGGGGREDAGHGDEDGVGTVARMVWKSLLPYRVEFEVTTTQVEPPYLLEGRRGRRARAASGAGGFYEQDGVTAVLYEWNVRTSEALDEPARAGRRARSSSGITTG